MENGSEDQAERIYICGHLGRSHPHHRHCRPHPLLPTGNELTRTGRVKTSRTAKQTRSITQFPPPVPQKEWSANKPCLIGKKCSKNNTTLPVDFTNILRAAFTPYDPKSAKKYSQAVSLFCTFWICLHTSCT